MNKIYEVWDGSDDRRAIVSVYAEAVQRVAQLKQPRIICQLDGQLAWEAYREDGRWWQRYADGRKRDVSRQMQTIDQQLAGAARWKP